MRYLTILVFSVIMTGCAVSEVTQLKAERYLCTADTVVWTTTSEEGEKITGHNYDGADSNYLFTNQGGEWRANGMGDGAWRFDRCDTTGQLCETQVPDFKAHAAVSKGAISRNPDSGAFYATGVRGDETTSLVFAVAGTCSQYLVAF